MALATDLVCGEEVEKDPDFKVKYKNKAFYFCSDTCKEKFINDPNSFVPDEMKIKDGGLAGEPAKILAALLGGATAAVMMSGDVAVVRDPSTTKIILPPDMPLEEAAKWVDRKIQELEKEVAINKQLPAFPMDGARAFFSALKKIFGWTDMKTVKTFFGDKPPQFIAVPVAYGVTEDVPWGRVEIPGIEGYLETGVFEKDDQFFFAINGKVKRKHLPAIEKIAEETRRFIETDSIYRGKAIRLEFSEKKSPFGNQKLTIPEFSAPTRLTKDDLILPLVTWKEVNAGIFTMIEDYHAAKNLGIPTKRANVCAGPFGTGKTLTAAIASNLCVEHGRTFILCADAAHFLDAIAFARQYAPAMVFVEDIDRIMKQERDADIDRILNTIDGADTKDMDILFVLTSNAPEKITQAFLRTGRSDMIIWFTPPDAKASARLVERYGTQANGRSILSVSEDDLREVGEVLAAAQMIPSAIREVVERAKLFALAEAPVQYDHHGHRVQKDISTIRIVKEDLLFASNGVSKQIELSKPTGEHVPDNFVSFGNLYLRKNGGEASVIEKMEEVHEATVS